MQTIDIKRVNSLFSDIKRETEFLSEAINGNSLDEKSVKAIKYSLIVTIEAMLQVCQHILAKKFKVPVSGYMDAFKKAHRYGIISESLSIKIQPLADLRNEFLIHGYWKCDDELLIGLIRDNLSDFHKFVKEAEEFITRQQKEF
ncbi:MAG TPA: DUF86 domain-containing protein [Nitrospirae bacterium]|nr:DUF86 domain-containing protein [Nitrospirota bacterium]